MLNKSNCISIHATTIHKATHRGVKVYKITFESIAIKYDFFLNWSCTYIISPNLGYLKSYLQQVRYFPQTMLQITQILALSTPLSHHHVLLTFPCCRLLKQSERAGSPDVGVWQSISWIGICSSALWWNLSHLHLMSSVRGRWREKKKKRRRKDWV